MLPELITDIPGPKSRECAEVLARHETRGVTWMAEDFPIFWEKAEGTNVWDVDGNRFLDFTSAFAVGSLGHSPAGPVEALREQSFRLVHAMGDVHPAGVKAALCRELSAVTFERWGAGPGKTFLCNSGSEAVEAALKTAFLRSGKRGVISFSGAYHGLGYGALEAGGMSYFRDPFKPQLGGFAVQVPFPSGDGYDLEQTANQVENLLKSHSIGAIIAEPVQGRGGENVPHKEFLPLLRRLCDAYGAVLVLDEIYTGFNRTGRLFACEHWGVVPDLICLGKALTGGFPLAACVGRAEIMDAWPDTRGEALHTSTMLGNPMGCAMALASISEHLKPEIQQQARSAGHLLWKKLSDVRSERIREVRGLGAMLGVELVTPDGKPDGELAGAIMRRSLQDGLILLGGGVHGNILSFSPAFSISVEETEFLRQRLQEYVTSLPGSIS